MAHGDLAAALRGGRHSLTIRERLAAIETAVDGTPGVGLPVHAAQLPSDALRERLKHV